MRLFFQAIGYYRVFAASSPKKLVQAHNLRPSMTPKLHAARITTAVA
jgi:hypothetical protein